jgi:hypothetical protein
LTSLGVSSLLVLVLIVPLTLLSRAVCLIVVVPTLVSGVELRTLGVVLTGVSVGLPLVLPFVVKQFFPFVLKANCLVQQSLEIEEIVALLLVVQWSNQAFQETFLVLLVCVHLLCGIT